MDDPPFDPYFLKVGAMTVLGDRYLQQDRFSFGHFADAREFAATTTYPKPKDITGVLVDEGEVWLTSGKVPGNLETCYWRHS